MQPMDRDRTAPIKFHKRIIFDPETICHNHGNSLGYDLCAINAPFP
jgi:hypothetical protein